VPAIVVGQTLIPQTGDWALSGVDPRFTPFYARFASDPGTSLIISDAKSAGGTFLLVWLGLDDFFLYAAYGADPTRAPLTDPAAFGVQLGAVFSHPAIGLLSNNEAKGVVGNFPDIFKMPHFTSVSYNPIPLEAGDVAALNSMAGFGGYNAALDGLIANKALFGVSDDLAAEIATRKLTFVVGCENKIMITDETLTDLGPYLDDMQAKGALSAPQRAGLAPFEQIRQTTPTDIIPLSTGGALGTPGTFGIRGVSEPLGDLFAIIPSERDAINAARIAYNAAIANIVAANPARLALADVNAALDGLIAAQFGVYNGVTITPNINPPTGIYSEDGVHPNTRGYAFLSRVFIQAINTKFGATIPLTSLADYQATSLPIP
jgi:lysophospholipase L1-like esterase